MDETVWDDKDYKTTAEKNRRLSDLLTGTWRSRPIKTIERVGGQPPPANPGSGTPNPRGGWKATW